MGTVSFGNPLHGDPASFLPNWYANHGYLFRNFIALAESSTFSFILVFFAGNICRPLEIVVGSIIETFNLRLLIQQLIVYIKATYRYY